MAELVIFSGKLKGKRLILPNREVIIGRDEDCHMRIASTLVSRKHCTLKPASNGIWVRDLESQNGTYVNDVAITDLFLMKSGDILRIGSALFQVPGSRPSRPRQEGGLSDDEISTWLSEDEQTESASLPDTTVIKGRQPPPSTPAIPVTAVSPAVSSESPTPNPDSRTVPTIRPPHRSVKEQAADIIRRHWEIVRGKSPE